MLDLAAAQGWIPLEQQPDRTSAFSYARPAGMQISAEDARNLARAIEAKLPTILDQQLPLTDRAFGEEHTEGLLSRRAAGQDVDDDDVCAARELLSGSPKRDAEQLAGFLRRGAFSIDAVLTQP